MTMQEGENDMGKADYVFCAIRRGKDECNLFK